MLIYEGTIDCIIKNRKTTMKTFSQHFVCLLNWVDSLSLIYVSNALFFQNVRTFSGLNHYYISRAKVKCLAQGHNTVPLMRLEPVTSQSLGKHSSCH